MKTVAINKEQGLYVIPCGDSYSCLGFEVADERRKSYLAWLGRDTEATHHVGTIEAYGEYLSALMDVEKRCAETRTKCPVELILELIGRENMRVEVTHPDGTKNRFWVGKSTGSIPIHLEIKTRRSSGGLAAYVPAGSTVRVVESRK